MGVDKTNKPRLYVRLPVKIIDETQIKKLHPNIIKVQLPRQKSRRWCCVYFESHEQLLEAEAALKKVKLNGKFVKVKNLNRNSRDKQDSLQKKSALANSAELTDLLN